MTALREAPATRQVFYHDELAPAAAVVAPSVFVAVRAARGRILLVRRCDSGVWELPGGRVDVGETAVRAAVREALEESGVHVLVTGLVGVYSDPGHVICDRAGEVRQQFALVFRARAVGGRPRPDLHETSEAAWVTAADLARLPIEAPTRLWITAAMDVEAEPQIA